MTHKTRKNTRPPSHPYVRDSYIFFLALMPGQLKSSHMQTLICLTYSGEGVSPDLERYIPIASPKYLEGIMLW